MFGKLTLNDIPYTSMIIMTTVAMMVLIVVIVAVLLTRYRKWTYLWNEWLCTVDHKRIGIMYIVLSLIMLLRGYADGIMMRVHQSLAFGESQGYLPPEHYNQIFSAHGVIMIIFMAMPFMTGLMNIIIPLQLGKRDVAFPFMNSVGLWLTVGGAMLMMVSLFIGEFSMAGWTGYPPYSEKTYSPGVGVDYWIWALTLSGAGSTMTGINFIVTILLERAPGMTLMRMPMFVWTTLCTSILIVLSFPALTVSTLLLALDRYVGMHFFTNDAGGNMMNYINLFWIWGHPEVYIVILPAFGIFSEVIATFSGKKLHGHSSLVTSVMVIAVLSFSVWLHHFFTMGASTNVNAVFGIATMLIAFPTGVKIFNWLLTMYRGRLRFDEPMLWALAFLPSFAVGGATGVLLAVPPVDFMMHNSEFLIAHFHNVLIPGALFGFVSGYVYWFPKAFGFRLDPYWGKLSFWFWLVGFYLAFMPLYVLGLMGMPRRMQHYLQPDWQPWLHIATLGAVCIFIGIACMVIQLIVSVKNRQRLADTTGDPWNGRNLEWSIPSPPPVYNFAVIPEVESIDAFHHMKKHQQANSKAKELQLEPIVLPKNTGLGFIFGVVAFFWAFAMVWEIWWLAVTAIFGLITILVMRSWDDDHEFTLSVDDIRNIERQHSQIGT